jgi:hypothetical protein
LTPAFLNELYGAESEELFLPGLADGQAGAATSATGAPFVPMKLDGVSPARDA